MMRPAPGDASISDADTARRWWSVRGVAAGVVLLAVMAGCAKDAPQDYLDPSGPIAVQADHLFRKLLWFAVVPVLVLVEALLVVALFRFRHRPGQDAPRLRDHKLRWVVAPTLILLAVDLFPLVGEAGEIFDLAHEPEGDVLQVEVYGHMWWWEYIYPESKISTANELHIPTGRPIRLTLRSIEPGLDAPEAGKYAQGVLHSFWVPKLAGKQDVVPGRDNKLTLAADKPGTYRGQCAEYCNLSHANMRLRVIAQKPADFEAWVREQQRPAVKPASGAAAAGYDIFTGEGGCISCHTVVGVAGAEGRVGPNLTHLKSRTTFAGAIFENTTTNLTKWVRDPPAMKPMRPDKGTGMPDQGLSDAEVHKVVAYLETLE
ncbi:MAG TPA: c-type cytochrome [Acidimicrobiia bacterium]